MDDFLKKMERKLKAEKQGKNLGGRPKKEIRKLKTVSVRLNNAEFEKVINDFGNSNFEKLSDFLRHRLMNKNEETIDKIDIMEYRITDSYNDLKRLRNFFHSGHFHAHEKDKFLEAIDNSLAELNETMRWLRERLG